MFMCELLIEWNEHVHMWVIDRILCKFWCASYVYHLRSHNDCKIKKN
jgi:hypothetical protein